MVLFLDNVQREIFAVKVSETETTIVVQNPVIVNAIPNQNQQMSLQLIPVNFREILEDQNEDGLWTYNKDHITISSHKNLAKQIEVQYSMLFKPIPMVVDPEETTDNSVVELFGTEDGE